ncbi:endolytic transglycosylase MltG [Pontibacillus litoralis]|uniref:Aminodeoxychorismate lyase n=1 Tax=Pontibacillus litoralis JSM 072002 TaxID=1385512 RepID=A0A0A5GDA2_9BACI|nr:endolytic transglycosylase MltG [Pontibacillus litoralis]KGX89188.1 hypothetical protein N784_00630 [Pontibacillus litoralis JSM 072002]
MKHTVRAFATGLFIATSILAFTYSQQTKKFTEDDAVTMLEEQGYHVLTEKQLQSYTNKIKQEEEKEKQKAEQNKKERPKDQQATITFTIESGMTPSHISAALHDKSVIEDEEAFIQYLQQNDFARYIQVGKYKISKDASYKEIAQTISHAN